MAIKHNIFKSVSTRIELPDGTKQYAKTINNEFDKFFTKDVLSKIDEAPRKNFSMAENKKYVFAQRDVDDYSCIKLTEANFLIYSDIIFAYTNVKFEFSEPNRKTIENGTDYCL